MLLGIDHLVIAVRSVDASAAILERDLGLAITGGGRHAGMGTVNRLAFLGDTYLELIGVEDAALVRANPAFAVGTATLAQLETRGEGLATFALATDDARGDVERLRASGSPVPSPTEGSRTRPDGAVIRWWMATPALGPERPPFLIEHELDGPEWGAEARTARSTVAHPVGGRVRLATLELPVADPRAVALAYGETLGIAFSEAWRATVGDQQVVLRPGAAEAEPVVELVAEAGTPPLDIVRFGIRWRRLPPPVPATG